MYRKNSGKESSHKIQFTLAWFATFLLLMAGVGCGGATKASTNPAVTAPTPLSTTPLNAVGGACSNTLVTATFSKAMNPAFLDGTTFTVTGGSASVPGQVTYDAASDTAIFTPSATLLLNTAYTATITTGARDTFGNALASNLVWSFTTGATTCQPGPPNVLSVGPPNGVNGVCPNTVAVAAFGAAMNPATINATTFTLTGPGALSVTGQISYDAPGRAATFTPSSNLALGTAYTATITQERRTSWAIRWQAILPGDSPPLPRLAKRRWCPWARRRPLKSWPARLSQTPARQLLRARTWRSARAVRSLDFRRER